MNRLSTTAHRSSVAQKNKNNSAQTKITGQDKLNSLESPTSTGRKTLNSKLSDELMKYKTSDELNKSKGSVENKERTKNQKEIP